MVPRSSQKKKNPKNPDDPNDPNDPRKMAQKHRYNCLKAVIGPLPVLPPFVEEALVRLLKNDYLLPSKVADQTEDHTNYRNALNQWVDHPVGQKDFETRDLAHWRHEAYLEWLYLQLSRSLIQWSNGMSPLDVKPVVNHPDAQGWIEDIVELLMTDNPRGTKRPAQRIIPLEVEGGPDGAAAEVGPDGGDEPEPNANPQRVSEKFLLKLLAPATVFEYIKTELAHVNVRKSYGQCAETYPMIHCAKFETHFLSPPTYFPEFAMR